MIEVSDLWKIYRDGLDGELVAVAGISFVVRPCEIYGLLGPNGAGKTTILRMLSTLLEPTAGSITVSGHEVGSDAESVRRMIGFVSNNTSIYDRLTAYETVEFFGRLHGLPKQLLRDRIESLFDRLQMNDFRNVLGGKLSTGMRQKVSIARALVHDPPVLVFDEPTLGLDVLAARALLQLIDRLRDEGKCIIFSTHIMREVERLCDRVAILHRGQMLAEGTVDELRETYGQDDFEEVFFGLVDGAIGVVGVRG